MTTTATHTMTALRHARFGEPATAVDVADIAIPEPGAGQVRVAIRAAGVGIGDWLTMVGQPYIARPSYGIASPKQPVLGQEFAGVVDAVGEGVTGPEPGDHVFGFAAGAFAEFAVADAEHVAPIPADATFEQAAALPVSAVAAYQALHSAASVAAGDEVLIIGASGAVGTLAIQVAKAAGAAVTAVVGTPNVDLARELGADHVIDYRRDAINARGVRYDAVVDLAGNRKLRDLRAVLAPEGALVIVGGSGGPVTGGFGRTVRAMLANGFVRQRLTPLFSAPNSEDLTAVAGLLADGKLTPVVDRTFPLSAAREALAHIGARHNRGKTLITVGA